MEDPTSAGDGPVVRRASGSDLRRNALVVMALIVWVVFAGILWREVQRSDNDDPAVVPASSDLPAAIEIEPGTTVAEIGGRLEELGLDTADNAMAIAADPTSLSLPGVIGDIDNLDGYIAPGRYAITPTSDAPTILTRMVNAFATQLSDEVLAEIDDQELDLDRVVAIAGLAQRNAASRSELPVVAGVLRNVDELPDDELGAVGADAIASTLSPISTSATEFHHAADGAVMLGPEPPSPLVSAEPADDLALLTDALVDPLDARTGVLAIGLDGQVVLDRYAHRFIETASVYKIATMAVIMNEVEAGNLVLDQLVARQLPNPGGGTAEALNASVSLREALAMSIEVSDNSAAERLLFGIGPDVVNARLRAWGIDEFNVGSTPQVATPRGVAQLMTLIVSGSAHEPASVDLMMAWLKNTPQNDRLPRLLTGGSVAHKTGTLESVVNDVGVLPTPAGDMVVVAMVEDVPDRFAAANAIAGLGQLVDSWFRRYFPAVLSAADRSGCERLPETESGPLAGTRIVVDAAHGGVGDPGATIELSEGRELVESYITLRLAEETAKELSDRGATVFLTRCDDTELSRAERAVLANEWGADLLLSLDYRDPDTAPSDSNEGLISYHRPDSEEIALAFADENQAWSAYSEPDDASTAMPANIINRSPTLLHLTLMPGLVIGPGSLALEAEAEALWAATHGEGTRTSELAAVTAGRLAALWTSGP